MTATNNINPAKEKVLMSAAEKAVVDDIKAHPEKHRHNFSKLLACCSICGIARPVLIMAHHDYVDLGKTNNGIKCDVTEGPCRCGTFHRDSG